MRGSPSEDLTLLHDLVKILQDLSDNSNLSSSYSSQMLYVASTHLDLATKFVEFVDVNNAPSEFPTRRTTLSNSDFSAMTTPLTPNQLNLQQFQTSFFGSETVSLSSDDNHILNDNAMSAMQSRPGLGSRHDSYNENMISTSLSHTDSAMSAYNSLPSLNNYQSFRCSWPAVVAPESDLRSHSGNGSDNNQDLSMFRNEPMLDLFTSWQTVEKGWQ